MLVISRGSDIHIPLKTSLDSGRRNQILLVNLALALVDIWSGLCVTSLTLGHANMALSKFWILPFVEGLQNRHISLSILVFQTA